jgi:SAM-dependent methyltransferase
MDKRNEIILHEVSTLMGTATLQQEPWFKTWFDSAYYHKLYQHHNDSEASIFVDTLIAYLQPGPGSCMLDLGCGKGRHSKRLAQKGFRVTGLDLSPSSIHDAQKWEAPALRFRQHDMRDRFGTACYDYIFSFFTSFGYFKNREENDAVIGNVAAALKPNGFVLLDYFNTRHVEKNLVAVEEREIDGTLYRINRWSTDNFIYKRIVVHDASLAQPLVYLEKVARFFTADFKHFFSAHGMKTVQFFGDYNLSAYHPDYSKRLIVLAKKS